jgi:hypothetical protein
MSGYVYGGSPASLAARTGSKPPTPPKPPKGKTPAPKPPGPTPPGELGPNQDAASARAAIQSILQPLIAQIQNAAAQRAKQGAALITGYTNNAVDKLNGINFQKPYQAAAQDQNAVNSALLASLGGQGSALQNQLSGELGSSVAAPTAGAIVGKVGADTTGAGNAGLANGDATLSSLIAQGAVQGAYGQKLPGIETLAGLQDVKGLQGSINNTTQQQLGDLQAKVPQMVQDELSSIATSKENQVRDQIAEEKNKIAILLGEGKITASQANALLAANTRTAIANQNNSTRAAIAGQNNATRTAIANQNNATKTQIAAMQAAAKAAGLKTKTKGALTDNEVSNLVDKWKNGTVKSVTTVPTNPDGTPKYKDANGNPKSVTQSAQQGQLTFQQAYKRLIAFGIPDKKARAYLDTAYKRGEQGRGWLTNEEQAALGKAGLPPRAAVVNGHGVLTARQYQALRKAGYTVPGQLTSEGAFVVAQVS